MEESLSISILGDGGWGTAMAVTLANAGHKVAIWGHDPGYLDEMRRTRRNRLFLPEIPLPDEVEFEEGLAWAIARAEIIAVAIPSRFLRQTLTGAGREVGPDKPVVSLTKGLDPDTLKRPSEVIGECLGADCIVALSGPSHAEEVSRSLPASIVAASKNVEAARKIQELLSTPRLRIYSSPDLVGVEIAGAVKNVIALAAGMAHGMGLGDNALAALATRGLAEMTRLGVAMGGDAATFAGLAGMGDLVTTCISPHGRNRRVGVLLAQGKSLDEILAGMAGVPESVTTTAGVLALAKRHEVECPITEQVAAILWKGKSPAKALDDLMSRAWKDEN